MADFDLQKYEIDRFLTDLVVFDHFVTLHVNSDDLGDTFSLDRLFPPFRKVVVVGHHVGDDRLLVRELGVSHILRKQKNMHQDVD